MGNIHNVSIFKQLQIHFEIWSYNSVFDDAHLAGYAIIFVAKSYQCFGEALCLYIGFISVERKKSKKFLLNCKTPEDGGSELLPNVGKSLPLNKP